MRASHGQQFPRLNHLNLTRFIPPISAVALVCCNEVAESPLPPSEQIEFFSERGQVQLEDGDYLGAIASFRMILHLDSLNVDALAGLSESYRYQKRTETAARYRRRASYLTYIRGRNALANNQLDDAIAGFKHTLAIQPHHPLASIGLGEISLKKGRRQEAVEHFKSATESAPDYSPGFVHLGNTLATLGRRSEARAAFERAISININSLDAYLGLGDLLVTLGEPKLAIEQFDNALLVDPQSAAAKSGRKRAIEAL